MPARASTGRRAPYALLATVSLLLSLSGCSNAPFPSKYMNGNTLFTYVQVEPSSLDPSFCYDQYDDPIACLIYPSFFRFHYLKQTPFQLQLDLGAHEPVIQSLPVEDVLRDGSTKQVNGQRWTFTLRHGIHFQDDPCFPDGQGREVTASDIVYAYKRMADPKTNCPIVTYLADKIVGFELYESQFAKYGHANYDRDIPGIQVDPHDPYTFSVTLNQPYPQLRYLMAMQFTSPQSREAVERYGDQYALHHPVGCGHFRLLEYRAHQDIILVKNKNTYDERFPTDADPRFRSLLGDAGKRVPFLDTIYIAVLTEPVTTYNLFQQGYLDTLSIDSATASVVPITDSLSPEMEARGIHLQSSSDVSTYYIAFNMLDSAVGGYTAERRALRQAISLAIDSKSLIDLASDGIGTQAQWVIPPGIFGYDPTYKNPYRQYDPSLKEAKALMVKAGYPNGIDPKTGQALVLHYDCSISSPVDRAGARLVQKMIEALGIRLEIRGTSFALFDEKVRKKQTQLFSYSWFGDYPDPENFVFLFYSPNSPPGPNHTSYSNPEYDKLFEQMRAMNDGPARLALIDKMRAIVVEDCPWIYTRHSASRSLLQPWVFDSVPNPLDNSSSKYVRTDSALRLERQREWNHAVVWPVIWLAAAFLVLVAPAAYTIRTRINRKVRRGRP